MNVIIIFWHIFFLVLGFLVGILVGRQIERRSGPPVTRVVPESQPAPAVDSARLKAGRGPAGKMWVEWDGKPLQAGQSLASEQQRDLSALLQELRPWLPAVAPVEPAAAVAAPVAVIPPKPVKQEIAPAVMPVMKSIIEQINDVLQDRLSAGPFKDRGIELVEGPGGSVVVVDGTRKYEGIESVTDSEVRTLIREAVAEWEKNAK